MSEKKKRWYVACNAAGNQMIAQFLADRADPAADNPLRGKLCSDGEVYDLWPIPNNEVSTIKVVALGNRHFGIRFFTQSSRDAQIVPADWLLEPKTKKKKRLQPLGKKEKAMRAMRPHI